MKKLPIASLKADPDNPRRIEEERLEALGVSLHEFGDLSGIVLNETTGQLVAGHQRLDRLKAAGAKHWHREGDRAWIEHPKTKERFPIRLVSWPVEKQRMANIVANSPELQGQYDETQLAQQLQALEEVANFEALRLDVLANEMGTGGNGFTEHDGLEEFDFVPAPRPTWIMVAAPDDIAAEIEAVLQEKFGADPSVRIEKSSNVD